jgi:plastocyanin
MWNVRRVLALGTLTTLLSGCGGSTPSSPSGGGGTPTPATTITLTSAGVSPVAISVSQGTRVLFVNNDNRQHEMNSDPHPEHTDCVEINSIGFISAGQTKETGNLNTIRTCRYHDHNDPNNTRFQGRIVIQ